MRMRESEVAARLAPLFGDSLLGTRSPEARTLCGVPVADMARALGIEVEPDAPELLYLSQASGSGHRYAFPKPFHEKSRAAVSLQAQAPQWEPLIDQLIAAYNDRPRWSHVDGRLPKGDARYVLVKLAGGDGTVLAAWWCGEDHSGGRRFHDLGRGTPIPVVEWMEMPK